MEKEKNIFMEDLSKQIRDAHMPEKEKNMMLKQFLKQKEEKLNIMITGATGCGKSSTINALFGENKAKVGMGADPETMEITKYNLDNVILWDSPGLGDVKEADIKHSKNIINKLLERDENGDYLIDLVLVILDGSTRDLGTSYDLINNVIIPNLGEEKDSRILIAINQCDVAMKGRYWNYENNEPEQKLVDFLEEKVESVKKRIKEATGVNVEPIYYSAGFKDGDEEQKPYNLSKLLYYIVRYIPKKKRVVLVTSANTDSKAWESNDSDYKYGIFDSIKDAVEDVVDTVGAVVEGIVDVFTGGCYITTATCEEYGKPDDCYELTTFRNFRDNWLKKQPDGEELIERYYKTAPEIVEWINRQPNRRAIYDYINKEYLEKCLKYIENGENEECKKLYIEMVNYLDREKNKCQ